MADKAAEEKDAKPDTPQGPKMILGLPLLQFVFIAVNLLVMLGAFAFIVHASLLYRKPAITEPQVQAELVTKVKKAEAESESALITIPYPEFTVTLKGEQGGLPHYAVVETAIICGSSACETQVNANKAKVEDAIQTVLAGRSYTELSSLETKFRTKHEILTRVNSFLQDTAIIDVLFTSFLVK